MYKKLLLVILAAIFLGGCTLLSSLTGNQAASDQQTGSLASSAPDAALDAMPSPGTGTDEKSLEVDINSTTILDEDFSDLN